MKPLLVVFVSMLAACANNQPHTVPVTVYVQVDRPVLPPKDLTLYQPPAVLPVWVLPTHPAASSCLTTEGEDVLRGNTAAEVERAKALAAWAQSAEAPQP